MKQQNKLLSKVFLGLIFIFLYAPIIFMIIFSFNSSKTIGHWTGFSFDWYLKLFANQAILDSLVFTLFIAISATAISTVLGIIASLLLYQSKKGTQQILLAINQIPIVSPDIIIGVSTMLLFLLVQIPFGWVSVLLGHIMFCTPIVIVYIMPRFKAMDPDLIAAAEDLGANSWQIFRAAILPSITPGIISGALMAFTFSLDDFVVTYFTSGEGISTLSIQIYTQIKRQVSPELNALSTLLFVFILLVIGIYLLTTRKSTKKIN